MHPFSRLAALALLVPLALPAGAAELRGTLELVNAKGRPQKGVEQAVIAFTPDAADDAAPAPGAFEIVTVRKEFQPRVLVVPKGSTVNFPNQDPILHNVFSATAGNRFDLGLYRKGEPGKGYTFENAGVARIFCNVHHSMVAHVVVLETSHSSRPERDGSFRLDGLPDGEGTLFVWHERGAAIERRLSLPLDAPLELRLEADKAAIPRHLNKFGKPYSRSRDADYR